MSIKPNLLLDLDQTLIYSEPSEDFDFTTNQDKMDKMDHHDMDGVYVIFQRPGLQTFLTYLFENFNISIWTAASKDYALFIINNIILKDPSRKLDWIFFSYHCEISKKHTGHSKSLSVLWDIYKIPGYSKKDTVIIDDYNEVFDTQRGNCIVAEPFIFSNNDSENDDFLIRLIPHLINMKNYIKKNQGTEPAMDVNIKLKVK